MSLALALLLVAPLQTEAPADDAYEEIVVEAKVGRVALIFDQAADGRLTNCRVFKSSGVDRIDAAACTSLPDCITSKAGAEYCGKLGASLVAVQPKAKPPLVLSLGLGTKSETPKIPPVGPAVVAPPAEMPDRLGKLPPPPKSSSDEPAIRLSGAQVEKPR